MENITDNINDRTTGVAYGAAAHRNRGKYSGQKVHRVITEYRANGTLRRAWPVCGVTNGQFAAQPIKGLTGADVTCSRCKVIEARFAAPEAANG